MIDEKKSNLEKLLSLQSPKPVETSINIMGIIFMIISIFIIFKTITNFYEIGLILSSFIIICTLMYFLKGLDLFLDFKNLTGMYGDSEMRNQLTKTINDFLILNKVKKLNLEEKNDIYQLNINNDILEIYKHNKKIYEYSLLEEKCIIDKMFSDDSINLLNFVNNSLFLQIKNYKN